MAGRNKQVYKITYPNGKIYVGMDLTGSISYFGSPSAKERIAADLAEHRLDLTARKQILWESDTSTDAEVRAMEMKLIHEHRSNDPAVGYNLTPKLLHPDQGTAATRMRWYAPRRRQPAAEGRASAGVVGKGRSSGSSSVAGLPR